MTPYDVMLAECLFESARVAVAAFEDMANLRPAPEYAPMLPNYAQRDVELLRQLLQQSHKEINQVEKSKVQIDAEKNGRWSVCPACLAGFGLACRLTEEDHVELKQRQYESFRPRSGVEQPDKTWIHQERHALNQKTTEHPKEIQVRPGQVWRWVKGEPGEVFVVKHRHACDPWWFMHGYNRDLSMWDDHRLAGAWVFVRETEKEGTGESTVEKPRPTVPVRSGQLRRAVKDLGQEIEVLLPQGSFYHTLDRGSRRRVLSEKACLFRTEYISGPTTDAAEAHWVLTHLLSQPPKNMSRDDYARHLLREDKSELMAPYPYAAERGWALGRLLERAREVADK